MYTPLLSLLIALYLFSNIAHASTLYGLTPGIEPQLIAIDPPTFDIKHISRPIFDVHFFSVSLDQKNGICYGLGYDIKNGHRYMLIGFSIYDGRVVYNETTTLAPWSSDNYLYPVIAVDSTSGTVLVAGEVDLNTASVIRVNTNTKESTVIKQLDKGTLIGDFLVLDPVRNVLYVDVHAGYNIIALDVKTGDILKNVSKGWGFEDMVFDPLTDKMYTIGDPKFTDKPNLLKFDPTTQVFTQVAVIPTDEITEFMLTISTALDVKERTLCAIGEGYDSNKEWVQFIMTVNIDTGKLLSFVIISWDEIPAGIAYSL